MIRTILFWSLINLVLLFSPALASKEVLVPAQVVNDFLKSGNYTKEEEELINKDLKIIQELLFLRVKPQKHPVYVATAGGPCASKSTILETYLAKHPGFVYSDPDQRGLRFMVHTYLSQLTLFTISQSSSYPDLLKQAYNKWRGGSNYIANTLLNKAFRGNYPIAHGTTATSKFMGDFYKKLKEKGYKIILLLCVSSDQNRQEACTHREKTQCFVQNDPKDTIEKGKMFFQNFPIYFKWADEIYLYWVDKFSEGWQEVGHFTPQTGLKVQHKSIETLKEAYESFRKRSPSDTLPGFEELTQLKKAN